MGSLPYVAECAVCGNGLLRLMECTECGTIAAVCDECELLWTEIADVYEDPSIEADGAYPRCPTCDVRKSRWKRLSIDKIQEYELDEFVELDSE